MSEKHPDILAKWDKFSREVHPIVEVLVEVTGGDARKLLQNYEDPESIYGQISQKLFDENILVHRYLLQNLWSTDRLQIKNAFSTRAGKRIRQPPKRRSRLSTSEGSRYCWCKRPEAFKNPASVQCDKCNEWFHCICSGVTIEEADDLDEFICALCLGSKLPSLFVTPKGIKNVGLCKASPKPGTTAAASPFKDYAHPSSSPTPDASSSDKETISSIDESVVGESRHASTSKCDTSSKESDSKDSSSTF